MSTKQLTAAIISSLKAAAIEEDIASGENENTPKRIDQAGTPFGGKEGEKRAKTNWLIAAASRSSARRELPTYWNILSLQNVSTNFARCELDSHADTCAVASNLIPLSSTGRACNVKPYNAKTYKPDCDIPITSRATAWTCQETGQTYILVVNEGLWFGEKLQNTLLDPNQLRYSGLTEADNPLLQFRRTYFNHVRRCHNSLTDQRYYHFP